MINILEVASSGREHDSTSRSLSGELISALKDRYSAVKHAVRDLNGGLPFVDAQWIEANFTADDARTVEHRRTLALSDRLVAELQEADVLVIGVAVYNFSVPASLKAWIDMISRARLTFRYTENGPKGLLDGKKAYLVVATGGVPVGSPMDFATPYLKHVLAFIGITDVEIIAADQLNSHADDSIAQARAQIDELVRSTSEAA